MLERLALITYGDDSEIGRMLDLMARERVARRSGREARQMDGDDLFREQCRRGQVRRKRIHLAHHHGSIESAHEDGVRERRARTADELDAQALVPRREPRVGAVLAEITDEWAEGHRYLDLDLDLDLDPDPEVLTKSRLTLVADTSIEEVTDSVLELSA